jgi:hypothetical protein
MYYWVWIAMAKKKELSATMKRIGVSYAWYYNGNAKAPGIYSRMDIRVER